MRPLRTAFHGNGPSKPPRKAGQDRAAQRRAAHLWSRRQSQVSALGVLILLSASVGALGWAERTGRLDVWGLKAEAWTHDRAADLGLYARNVEIGGLQFTRHEEVIATLRAHDREPLARLNPHHIATRLEQLPWVETAVVQRRWPDNLTIWISEKTPLAVLHQNGHAFVVERSGEVITEASADLIRAYPNISGVGAAAAAPELVAALQAYPDLFGRFVGATHLSSRRWNLYLAPGVEVRLPEEDLWQSLANLSNLHQTQNILEKDIVALDLRTRRPLIVR